MATVASLLAELSRSTRPDRAAAWDPVGIQFGDPAAPVARVAVCHEVTEAIVARLSEDPPDLVVAYHPLLFRPTTRLVAGASPAGRAWRLISAGVALVVTHTDFDAAPGGTADALAACLGLDDPVPFGPVAGRDRIKVVVFVPTEAEEAVAAAMVAAGAGTIGNYDSCSFRAAGEGRFRAGDGAAPVIGSGSGVSRVAETRLEMLAPRAAEAAVVAALVAAHPYEEPAFDVYDVRSGHGLIGRIGSWEGSLAGLAEAVAARLGRRGLRVAGDARAAIGRVAVVPGSGAEFLEAAAAGADAIVTGDVGHHRAVSAVDAGLAVVDPGHAATELPGMTRLVGLVTGLGVEVMDLTGDGSGPWIDPGSTN